MANAARSKIMNEKIINIAKEFSKYPGPRYITLGPNSGEKFRKNILVPAFTNYESVTVILDGTLGYGSSFLEEAFGGIVREEGLDKQKILDSIKFISTEEPELIDEIREYISNAC